MVLRGAVELQHGSGMDKMQGLHFPGEVIIAWGYSRLLWTCRVCGPGLCLWWTILRAPVAAVLCPVTVALPHPPSSGVGHSPVANPPPARQSACDDWF